MTRAARVARGTARLLGIGAAGVACSDYTIRQNVQTDVFEQERRSAVDVLLVVDNSGSMVDEQERLAQSFEDFIAAFGDAEVDYQIGVVTTDVYDEDDAGILRGQGPGGPEIITPDTEDAADVFADVVSVGTLGAGLEAGLEAARLALSEPRITGANAGFLREDASLSIVFVSDENDLSPDPVDTYLDFFYLAKSPNGYEGYRDPSLVDLSAVVGPEPDGCNIGPDDEFPAVAGTRYIRLSERSGGVHRSICEQDFSELVTDLGLTISGLRSEFPLSRWPEPDTLEVEVDDDPVEEGWAYEADRNSLVFDSSHIPESGATVAVSYEVAPGPGTGASGEGG